MALNIFIGKPATAAYTIWTTRLAYGDQLSTVLPELRFSNGELAEFILLETSNANAPIYAACTGYLSTKYPEDEWVGEPVAFSSSRAAGAYPNGNEYAVWSESMA